MPLVPPLRHVLQARSSSTSLTSRFEPGPHFPIFLSAQDLTVLRLATGARNAHASVWKKTQASLNDRDQTSDQKIDV
jgi:hypothetical protein